MQNILWSHLSEAELGWVAGIIDGEGSLSIGFQTEKKIWACTVCVRNTSKLMVDHLLQVFGGKVFLTKYRYKGKDKPVWAWRINPTQIRDFLTMIYPYLVSKKQQAKLLIEMRRRIEERVGIEMLPINYGHRHSSMHIMANERIERQKIYEEIKQYNRSGGR